MGLFSLKKQIAEAAAKSAAAAPKSNLPPEKESLYEAMVQNLLKESKTSMGFMGKSSVKAAVQMLLPNEIPRYAILTNVSVGDPQSAENFNTRSLKEKTNGVLILSDERLLFAGALGKAPVSKALDLSAITVVDDSDVSSVVRSVLRVETADTILAIDGNRPVLLEFCYYLEAAVKKAKRKG
jgi:hypothetical protein